MNPKDSYVIYSYELHFNLEVLNAEKRKGSNTRPLYPYHTVELTALFVYGTDFKREVNILFEPIPEQIQLIAGLIVLFVLWAAIVLYMIRRKLNLPRNEFSLAFMECITPFIGGGNMRIRHKWEKWFFIILIFGAFFIVAVFAGCLLDAAIRIQHQRIETFEQLAQIDSPIFIRNSLDTDHVCKIINMEMEANRACNDESKMGPTYNKSVCFVLIVETFFHDVVMNVLKKTDRDFDVLKESLGKLLNYFITFTHGLMFMFQCLGEISSSYYLQSEYYVPDWIIETVNKITGSMLENGFHQFYESLREF